LFLLLHGYLFHKDLLSIKIIIPNISNTKIKSSKNVELCLGSKRFVQIKFICNHNYTKAQLVNVAVH
jgi:hypothetical protein